MSRASSQADIRLALDDAHPARWPSGFRLAPEDFTFHGHALRRPECVLCLRDGSVLASNRDALVTLIRQDGSQASFGSGALLANTFALGDDGTMLVADFRRGALLLTGRDARAGLLHDAFDGQPLGSVNFVMAGEEPETWWLSVSTREADYRRAIADPRPDGRIFRADRTGLTLVGDGLYFPNAMQIDPQAGYLYVAETTAGAISRARLEGGGRLGAFSRFGPSPLYPGAYTDGLALDTRGNVWVTELSRNALLVLDRDGVAHPVFEDVEGRTVRTPTHLAFGGPDLRTVFVGSLKMSVLPAFRSPVPGRAPRHWREATWPSFLFPKLVASADEPC